MFRKFIQLELQLGVSETQDISIEPPAKRSRGQDNERQYNSVFKAKIVLNLEVGVSPKRNRKLSKENFRLPMQQWHATTRERLIRTGCADSYNSKWDRYAPEQRFNVDQSPCPFVINTKKTYEMLEKNNPNNREHKVWTSQLGSGLDKRQCTLQVCFQPTGKQPRVVITSNGKGKG
ncbi:hypothetical protein LOD99_5266 [Oopsacas minuta]|uniref:Uncharacterized protein n=1 Tax=Oopsacas minuta TaxID=111878 RepID=A0AAV7JR76_9METZ|nr:hypothetical protein LOD99_5266 [Oopsacas minuta]